MPIQLIEAGMELLLFVYLARRSMMIKVMLKEKPEIQSEIQSERHSERQSKPKLCRLLRSLERFPDGSTILCEYMMLYAGIRFILEFFRGDVARGIFGRLSTSQWISIGIIAVIAGISYRKRNSKTI